MASSSVSSGSDDIPSPLKSVSDYLAHLQSRVQPLTRTAAQLPGPSDLSFHRSLDRSLNKDLDSARADILSTLNSLLDKISSKSTNLKGKAAANDPTWNLKAEDLIEGSSFQRKMGEVVDTLLEKADTRLDEHQGKIKPASERTRTDRSKASDKANGVPAVGPLPSHLLNANIQPLPQHKFSKKPNNSRETDWQHSLAEKPHAKVPLSWRPPSPGPEEAPYFAGTRQGMYCAEGDPRSNPYYFEIQNYAPAQQAFDVAEVDELKEPPPLQKEDPSGGPIPFLWVDDENSFEKLYSHLAEEKVKEIAIDVEHHNFRSYQGLVCLVQVSTRWQDYIIDALSPQIRTISHRLNQIFANPEKVKILHGAEHDILWLQRDLNLYIVGLFDTYHATNVLNFPFHSLAFLLSRYIDFEADKRYQLADWRIRPLNKEMLFYARSDTHSLIYIYDCIRLEIQKKEGEEGIEKVFELSKRTASKTYAKEVWDTDGEGREGWRTLWKRLGGMDAVGVDARWEKEGVQGLHKTERIFRGLHDWRDQVARLEDESPRYILSTSHLLNLSSRAPTTQENVIPCVGPAFKKRAGQVAKLIANEVDAFQKVQKEKEERERANLKSGLVGGVDEEMGEVVARETNGMGQSLWPIEEASSSAQGPSAIASLLFGDEVQKNAEKPMRSSLFAPLPKSVNSTRVLSSIKSELTSALKGILGMYGNASDNNEIREEMSIQPEMTAFVPKQNRMPFIEANTATSHTTTEPVQSLEAEDVIVKVKKDKKRSASEDQATPKQKKGKWTKEQKEQRKRERESKEEALKAITPFDYSNAKSVLDSKPAPAVAYEGGSSDKKKKKDKKISKESGSSSYNMPGKKEEDRYASITVRRDRREQQGGKSMSFSR